MSVWLSQADIHIYPNRNLMDRYKEITEHIKGSYKVLSRNHKKVADYFVDNFDKIPFLNVQDIAKSTGTSVASVVRFAQRIGFDGFSELRDAIAESFQDHINKKEIFPLFEKHKAEEDLLTEVANVDITNINSTLNLIERKVFNEVIDTIIKSGRVFTAGLGISYLLSELLAYQLTQVGMIHLYSNIHTHSSMNRFFL
jgi:DNA-binding MurR/RpiR family transcriptional regulator